jgi:hypothetical protein
MSKTKKKGLVDFYTSYDDLSQRSKNIITNLGGLEEFIKYAEENETFFDLKNVGEMSNMELSAYAKYLRESKEKETPVIKLHDAWKYKISENISEENWIMIIDVYKLQKRLCSERCRNVFESMEISEYFEFSIENKINFIRKFFLHSFNFEAFRNIGVKSLKEIDSIINIIRQTYNDIDKIDILTETDEISIARLSLYEAYTKRFDYFELTTTEIEILFQEKYYSLVKILILNMNYNLNKGKSKPTKKGMIIDMYFFTETLYSFRTIAQEISCSLELVRNYIRNFVQIILPNLVIEIKHVLGNNYYEPLIISNETLINVKCFSPFIFRDKSFIPNERFTIEVYKLLLIESHVNLNQLIKEELKINHSITSKDNLFILLEWLNNTNFRDLIRFLNEEIYNFRLHNFEFNLEVLIKRFYTENDINIDLNRLHDVVNLIKEIVNMNIEIEPLTLRKNQKNVEHLNIVSSIVNFIKEKQTAQDTKDILIYISSLHFEIKKDKLLRILNNNMNSFKRVGNGTWTLTEWGNTITNNGTIRDMVEKIIIKRNSPVHISELINEIEKARSINPRSLLNNLNAGDNEKYLFFNCGFIGLKSIDYDKFWYLIPKFSIVKTRQILSQNNLKPTLENISHLSHKLGYPEEHLKYIFKL